MITGPWSSIILYNVIILTELWIIPHTRIVEIIVNHCSTNTKHGFQSI